MRRNRQAGQALYVTAASMVVLAGFLGLGIDMGMLRYEKRIQQTAADAAALAGANNLANGGVTTGAQNASAKNGFADSGSGDTSNCGSSAAIGTVCVQVNSVETSGGPQSGPHTGNSKYVEVLVAAVHSTYFMRVFGVTRETVTARAVATNTSGGTTNGCLYTLGPPNASIEGVNIQGSAQLLAPSCGINDNGNYDPTGGTVNLIIKADTFGVAGSDTGHGGNVTCYSGQSPCPAYSVPTAPDPFCSSSSTCLTAPPQPSTNYGSVTTAANSTNTLNPGTYSSITFGKNSTTTLNPGVYYINGSGGVTFKGGGTVTGSGVMIYFTNNATLNAVGGANLPDIRLSAMTAAQSQTYTGSDAYAGVLMYQDPNDTAAPSLGGDDNSSWSGALYFPSVQLTFFGNAKGSGYTIGMVVAKALALTGNPTVTLLGTPGMPPGVNLFTVATLVE